MKLRKECTLFECQCVKCKSTNWRHLMFMSPDGDSTAILSDHLNHVKVYPFAGKSQYLHFSVISRPWVLAQAREFNPRPPARQSSALPTDLILSQLRPLLWVNTKILVLGPHQSTRFWVCPVVCLLILKKGQCLFSWSAWKKIRKHTSGDYLSSLECPEQATLVVLNFMGLQFRGFF